MSSETLPPSGIASAFLHATEALFDAVADTVYFAKDADGVYVSVNRTLVERLGKRHKSEVVGHTADDLFPPSIARTIRTQDRATLAGRSLEAQLEKHLHPGGGEGWCLTWKEPVRAPDARVVGLTGISRDVTVGRGPVGLSDLAAVAERIDVGLDGPLRIGDLAAGCGLSPWQLDQRMRAVFGLGAGQYVARARMERACALLRAGEEPIAAVALGCGYGDQAAFTRAFRRAVGLTPSAYRVRARDPQRFRMD